MAEGKPWRDAMALVHRRGRCRMWQPPSHTLTPAPSVSLLCCWVSGIKGVVRPVPCPSVYRVRHFGTYSRTTSGGGGGGIMQIDTSKYAAQNCAKLCKSCPKPHYAKLGALRAFASNPPSAKMFLREKLDFAQGKDFGAISGPRTIASAPPPPPFF